MPGRPRKTLEQHVRQGTFVADRHSDRGFEALQLSAPGKPGALGAAPKFLNKHGKAEWKRITEHPTYSVALSEVHRGAVEEYCWLAGRLRGAMSGEPDPLGPLTATQENKLHSLRMQLGLTPASAAKVSIPQTKPESKWTSIAQRTAKGPSATPVQ